MGFIPQSWHPLPTPPEVLEEGERRSRWLTLATTFAAVAVGLAIQIQDGEYTPASIGLITAALLAMGLGICVHSISLRKSWLAAILLFGLAIQFLALFTTWPGVDLPHGGRSKLVSFSEGLAISIVLLLWCVFGRSRLLPGRRLSTPDGSAGASPSQVPFLLLLLTSLLLAFWMVRCSPHPHIDVWYFQQGAARELLDGHNPYTMTFPDIYHSTLPGYPQEVYGPGLVVNDRLQFGFPYPPVSLFLATIGYAVAHDHRYAQAVALVVAGAFIGYSRPGVISKLAAALLLFTPRVFFVLGRAWTEPFTIMLLAATVFLACRHSKLLPIALGLLIATKQYMILALPISFFLLAANWRWRDWFDLLWKAVLVACIVTLPLALLDWHAFWKSTVTVQELAPFRWDAISYLVWYGFRHHSVSAPWIAVFWSTLAALVTLALCLWWAPRNPMGFAASIAFILLAFFSFNKQAFCNYYFFVIGAMACAIGAAGVNFMHGTEPGGSLQPVGSPGESGTTRGGDLAPS